MEQPVRRDAAWALEAEAAGQLAKVPSSFDEPVAGLTERCPGMRVAELLPRGRTGAPQIVGAEQHPQGVVLVARFDQRLGLVDQGPEAVGVDADRAAVELDEAGTGDRNPVQRRGQSEEAMEPRQPRVDAPRRQIEDLAGEIELADRLRRQGQRHEQGADLGGWLHDHAVNRDP